MSLRGSIESTLHDVWSGRRRWLGLLLWPLSFLYGIGARLHRALYLLGLLKRAEIGVPVLSVGNLIVGGAGKTPVTLEISRRLLEGGRRVAIVSRGYGRRSAAPVVIVSDGTAVRGVASECGDEPLWLARKLPAAIVVVGAKRSDAAATAIELGADLIVLDDGFSHHALKRTVEVLVVNGDGGLGNRRLLPAGPLREPASAARRADLLWMSRATSGDVSPPPGLPRLPSVRSTYEAAGLVTLDLVRAESIESLQNKRILGVCGIARPDSFRATLARSGAIVRDVIAFPDHHSFTAEDVARVEKVARDERCEFIVTTEKDAMRLAEVTSSPLFRALAMETKVVGDAAALDALIRRFAQHRDVAGAA